MRTYEQDLRELNLSAEQFDRMISEIYDMTNEQMTEAAKRIREGSEFFPAETPSAWVRAFERVLSMRYPERLEAYNIFYGKGADKTSPTMSRLAAMAESGVSEVPFGTFKFGQLEILKRESQILGVDQYLNFHKRDCDIEIREGFLEEFNKNIDKIAGRQQSRIVQEKKMDGPKL